MHFVKFGGEKFVRKNCKTWYSIFILSQFQYTLTLTLNCTHNFNFNVHFNFENNISRQRDSFIIKILLIRRYITILRFIVENFIEKSIPFIASSIILVSTILQTFVIQRSIILSICQALSNLLWYCFNFRISLKIYIETHKSSKFINLWTTQIAVEAENSKSIEPCS